MKKDIFLLLFIALVFILVHSAALAQPADDLELNLDINSWTTPTPKIIKPNIDLSGRGFHKDNTWPQSLAAKEAIDAWKSDIGFNGFYRLQYNLWEISQFSKDKDAQAKILANYDYVIKAITDSGGTVIVNIFGTPKGMGKILDANSAPVKSAAFKELIKSRIKELSCEKKYNIWYEVWNSPDLGDFFLGKEQEYLNVYKLVAESVKELEDEYKINIPLGGPGSSWWFHNLNGNTILTPENSLIYQLIKFCDYNNLPLDFISWHAFSSNPEVEGELTVYKKNSVELLKAWLSYFRLDNNTPLIVDEWNYDRDANVLPARREKAYISASYIPSRIKGMLACGLDNQIYFSLEDFQNNNENVTRNTGIFYYADKYLAKKSGTKASYNVFKMLKELGPDMYSLKFDDEFVGTFATKSKDKITLMIYNYIDPDIVTNYLSENISALNPSESKFILNAIRSDILDTIISSPQEINSARTTARVKALLKKAQELKEEAEKLSSSGRSLKISLKNINGDYLYSRFNVDSSCSFNCDFKPVEEKELSLNGVFQQELLIEPYSVSLIILNKKQTQVQDNNAASG
jgi:hypothetical protein